MLVEACVATVVLVVAMLIFHQLFAVVAKRGGILLYLLILLMLNVLPPITAAILDCAGRPRLARDQETVASLSPAAYYIMNMARWAPDVRGGWLIALYLLLAAAGYRLLQRWLRRQSAVVDRKLESMGLREAAQPA